MRCAQSKGTERHSTHQEDYTGTANQLLTSAALHSESHV